MAKALILIDIQNFYFGEKGLTGCVQASQNAKELLSFFRERNMPVFHVMHDIDRGSLKANEKYLMDIHDNVKPVEGETVIVKLTPGSFKGTDLLPRLKEKEIDELVICGMMSHMCVDTTTREAFDLGFKCTVIHDACATRPLSFNGVEVPAEHVHASAMAALSFAFANLMTVEEFTA
ncbi:MAG: cysteine hydrolase family protein [Bacillota bacterium]|nr:cysteine hydrolase family protein [Bacillota bacterium]